MVREVIAESLAHTAAMLPLLFLAFLAMEAVNHKASTNWLARAAGHKALGPVAAAGLGLLPQCGFSVAATVLWVDGFIPTGSLLAAYLATSDEAVPVLISSPSTAAWVLPLLAAKLAWGAIAGTLVNLIETRQTRAGPGRVSSRQARSVCTDRIGQTGRTGRNDSCVGQGASFREYLDHALSRTARTAATVFVLTSALGLATHAAGPGIGGLVSRGGPWQPALATVIGLIPSCATSVALAEGFRTGVLSFPALLSGLSANAGVGVLVLLKESRGRGKGKKAALVLTELAASSFALGWLARILTL